MQFNWNSTSVTGHKQGTAGFTQRKHHCQVQLQALQSENSFYWHSLDTMLLNTVSLQHSSK
jgi:hypothetical protein